MNRIPWLRSIITGPSIGRPNQITSSPQSSIWTVVGSGKSLRPRINSTSLFCPGCFQGICSATETTIFHISRRELSGSSFSLSPGRLSGKRLSISTAAFPGEIMALGWGYVLWMWKIFWSWLVVWTLKDEIEGIEGGRISHDDRRLGKIP